jgi:glycosyltransferase involved in cell wall biosynthesis
MPLVSIIVPCYNEEATIRLLLQAIERQTWPKEQMEVILADGMSTDRTRAEVEKFCVESAGLEVRVVDNVKRNIPSGLNRAIEQARGEFIVRLDAHSVPADDFVQNCLRPCALAKAKMWAVSGISVQGPKPGSRAPLPPPPPIQWVLGMRSTVLPPRQAMSTPFLLVLFAAKPCKKLACSMKTC